jgi:hypothetical protein
VRPPNTPAASRDQEPLIDRAVVLLFRAIVASAKDEPAALDAARTEFLEIAEAVGPGFEGRVLGGAIDHLLARVPKARAAPSAAAAVLLSDCIRLFGDDLCWDVSA